MQNHVANHVIAQLPLVQQDVLIIRRTLPGLWSKIQDLREANVKDSLATWLQNVDFSQAPVQLYLVPAGSLSNMDYKALQEEIAVITQLSYSREEATNGVDYMLYNIKENVTRTTAPQLGNIILRAWQRYGRPMGVPFTTNGVTTFAILQEIGEPQEQAKTGSSPTKGTGTPLFPASLS